MLTIATFHYIREGFSQLYPSIFGVTPIEFEKQLDILGSIGHFISLNELIKALDNQAILDGHNFLITFDDGLKEQFTFAFPILQRKGIPFVCFISTSPLEKKEVLTVHKIHLLRSVIEPGTFRNLVFKFFEEREIVFPEIPVHKTRSIYKYDTEEIGQMKYLLNSILNIEQRKEFTDIIFKEYYSDEIAVCQELYMEPSEVRRLAAIDSLGTHGHSHIPLGLVSKDIAQKDISTSVRILKQIAEKSISSLSYPYGFYEACAGDAQLVAHAEGITVGFTFEHAINVPPYQRLHLARFSNNDLPGGSNNGAIPGDYWKRLPKSSWRYPRGTR